MHNKKRAPRALNLTLPNSRQPYLVWQGEQYTIRDFSQNGIGLWVPPAASRGLKVGSHLSAEVVITDKKFSVHLEIKHSTKGVVGLQIVGASPELGELFHRLLEPTMYAAKLEPNVKSGADDLEMGFPRLWYQGPGGCELILWYNGFQRMLMALQLCWLGKWIYRHQFDEPKTGFLPDQLILNGVRLQTKDLLTKHPKCEPELIQQASQFLAAVPVPLPGAQLWQFLQMGEQVYLPSKVLPHSNAA
jgi:hypothetical protein